MIFIHYLLIVFSCYYLPDEDQCNWVKLGKIIIKGQFVYFFLWKKYYLYGTFSSIVSKINLTVNHIYKSSEKYFILRNLSQSKNQSFLKGFGATQTGN